MLNKLQFNNMVISNKKGIQQARLQTINKLVHKIRKLKTLLEKRPEDTKCKQRVRKSTETLEILKKLKRVDIVKNVLLMPKPSAAYITNGLSTSEEVAAALLAMNKVMQSLIKRFKTELKLDDAVNSTWRDELQETSKRRQKIARTEEKKLKRIALKEQKTMERNRQEWLEQNCQEGEQGEENKKDNISTIGSWKIEEIEEAAIEKVVKNKIETKVVQPKRRPVENTNKNTKDIQIKKPKLEKVKPVKKFEGSTNEEGEPASTIAKNIQTKKLKREKSKQIKKFDSSLSEEVEPPSLKSNAINSHEDDEVEESDAETHVVDPFFVTETGENYLSTAVSKRSQNTNEDEMEQKDLHMIKLNGTKKSSNFHDRRQYQNNDKYAQKQNKWGGEKSSQRNDSQKYNNPRKQNEWAKQNGPQQHKEKFSKAEEKLHPSWAAKQKIKPVIANFQGKKITFGDDDTSRVEINAHVKAEKNDKKITNNESLHPSWVAKQKQKPIITAFQGKKITFE